MSKAVLISIQPKWCELIASGKKTIEVRKTKPNLTTPFKCYIYQTKRTWIYNIYSKIADWQQKVIGEFVCDGTEKIIPYRYPFDVEGTFLTNLQIMNYGGNKPIYFWHISNLKIYDKPKELSEFYKTAICDYNGLEPITRPSQSWCYVELLEGVEK